MNLWKWITLALVLLSVAGLVLIVTLQISPWVMLRSVMPDGPARDLAHDDISLPRPVTMLGALLTLYLSGVVLLFLFPERIRRVSQAFTSPPSTWLRLAALGLLASLLVTAAGVGSAFNVVTFPVTIFLSVSVFISILFGGVGLAFAIGRVLLVKSGWQLSPLVALFLGDLLLFVLMNLPWIGAAGMVLIVTLGLGVAIASRFGSGQPWSLSSLHEDERV